MVRSVYVTAVAIGVVVLAAGCGGGKAVVERSDRQNCVELWNLEAGANNRELLALSAESYGTDSRVLVALYDGPEIKDAAIGLESIAVVSGDCVLAMDSGTVFARTDSGWILSGYIPTLQFDKVASAVFSGESNAQVLRSGDLVQTGYAVSPAP